MQKRKVIQFFVLFVAFVTLLGFLQVMRFGSLTGYTSMQKQDATYAVADSNLLIDIEGYSPGEDELRVYYRVYNYISEEREVRIIAHLEGKGGIWLVEGVQDIIAPANSSERYIMYLDLPSHPLEDTELTLDASSNGQNAIAKRYFSLAPSRITGYSVFGKWNNSLIDILIIMLIIVVILILFLIIHRKHKHLMHDHHLKHRPRLENYQHRYVSLDVRNHQTAP